MAKETHTDAAMEVSDQAEYNSYLTEAPIADFAKYAGIDIDEAVNRRVAAAIKKAPLDMEATVRLPMEPQKNLLGYANVTFNGSVTVTDFKVLQDKDGNMFAALPSKPVGGGKYSPTTWIKGDEAKEQFQNTVLTAYHTAVEKLKQRAAALTGEKPAPIREQLDKAGKQAAEHNAGRDGQVKDKKERGGDR